VAQDAEAALETFLEPLRIPGEPGTDAWRVARRALVNLRVGTSSETGAIVASIARQPPYALDSGEPDAATDAATDAPSEGGDAGDGGVPHVDAGGNEEPELEVGGGDCGCSLPVGAGSLPLGWLMLALGALVARMRRGAMTPGSRE
jgi:hypothetical protein